MENEILLLPLTHKEFKDAQMGRILQKRFEKNGDGFCFVISNRFISFNDCENLRRSGFSVYPLDITGVSWQEIDRKFRSNLVIEYDNGLSIALVSQNVYHQFQKEQFKK